MTKDTGALDLLATTAMQFLTGKSFAIGEAMKLTGIETPRSCNPIKRTLMKQKRSALSKPRNDAGNTAVVRDADVLPGEFLKREFSHEGFATKKMQGSHTVLVDDRCSSFQLTQRELDASLNVLHGETLIVHRAVDSAQGYTFQGRQRRASVEQDQRQGRENELKLESLLAADEKEKEQAEPSKQYRSLGQFIEPTTCILQSVQNSTSAVRNRLIACSKGECDEASFKCHEAQEADDKSAMRVFVEITTPNGHCNKDVTIMNERDPLIRSKRGRSQVLPIRFLDSIVPPLRGKPRRRQR